MTVLDEQSAVTVDVDHLGEVARGVLVDSGTAGGELSLSFVDEEVMAELNQRYLDGEGPTDVLAFPIDTDDGVGVGRSPDGSTAGPDRDPVSDLPMLLGDVVICPAVAAANAPTHAGTYDDEIALLVVHGILHVLGMDHADPEQAAAMQVRERALLDRFAHPAG